MPLVLKKERQVAVGRVVEAVLVGVERLETTGRIIVAGGVVIERLRASGGVVESTGVGKSAETPQAEFVTTPSNWSKAPYSRWPYYCCRRSCDRAPASRWRCVVDAAGVGKECENPECRVVAGRRVGVKRLIAAGRIVVAGGVGVERNMPPSAVL